MAGFEFSSGRFWIVSNIAQTAAVNERRLPPALRRVARPVVRRVSMLDAQQFRQYAEEALDWTVSPEQKKRNGP